jgi:5,5'-dehydrodivanillate O-demethylase oxygenase subunit
MLSREENELLTRVGPGTPCGELMRRYWHPILPEAKLRENPVQKVRILCEDLVCYRDRRGTLGLIGPRCPHRAVDLQFGIPEDSGLRCPYHGWLFSESGTCLQMPLEPPDSSFKDRIHIKAYAVQEMGGLIWAYLGPQPAPLLPRWDLFVRPDGFRQIVGHWLPCNWLQVMENRGDLSHGIYLHGRLFQYALEREGKLTDDPEARYNATMAQQNDRLRRGVYTKYRPVYNQFGFTKGYLESEQDEQAASWNFGMNPILFPYTLVNSFGPSGPSGIRQSYQIGVPVDDTTTWHFQYFCYVFPAEVNVPEQEFVPHIDLPLKDEHGDYVLDYVLSQDMVAWYGQGAITDREEEHLGVSDACVLAYRKLLGEQIELLQDGGEPINVFRDRSDLALSELSIPVATRRDATTALGTGLGAAASFYRANYHKMSKGGWLYIDDDADRFCPDRDTIVRLYRQTELAWEAKQKSSATSQ